MTKKLSLLFTLMLSTLMASAYDAQVDGIYYNLIPKGKVAEVTRGDTEYTGSVTIPGSFTYNGVTYSVTSIGSNAFSMCYGLTSVAIPNSVTSIGVSAFKLCRSLSSVHITNIAAWCKIKFDGYESNPLSSAHHLFMDGKEITDLVIPNGVTSIGNYAFWYCYGLTSVTIPNSVTSIGDETFMGCSDLASLTIGNGVTSIGKRAIFGCSGLNSIIVESGNEKYDSRNNCNAIIETATNNLILGCKNTVIPNGLISIGTDAFYLCSDLTSITIPNSVTSIGTEAFASCSGLTSVTIPNSVTTIGDGAFESCSGLTSVTVSNSVTSIGGCAFWYCSSLTSVTIGSGVTSIGVDAFADCSELTDVYCYAENVPSTNSDAFRNSYVEYATLYVPESSVATYKATGPWSGFGNIVALPEPTIRGDVNGDGEVNVGDLVSVSNYMAGDGSVSKDAADVNEDGEVNVGDMVVISNIMSGNE